MVIVSTRDFRQNQSKYLGMANEGENVILKSRSGNFRIYPVSLEEPVSPKRNLAAELRSALIEVKENMQGKRKLHTVEELIDELRDTDD